MRVRDAMTPSPLVVTPSTSVMSARRIMRHAGIRHLPVLDGDVLIGMLSDRDVIVKDPYAEIGRDSGPDGGRQEHARDQPRSASER